MTLRNICRKVCSGSILAQGICSTKWTNNGRRSDKFTKTIVMIAVSGSSGTRSGRSIF